MKTLIASRWFIGLLVILILFLLWLAFFSSVSYVGEEFIL